jgi:glycosyltransferase involved in cell wall biosynthesis
LINLPSERIAELMAGSLAAYLPYPDGASYRRGSLLAALTNGLPVITTVTTSTPPGMTDVVLPATGPAEALMHLERLYSSPGEVSALSRGARQFANRFSWTEIAREHEQVYNQTLLAAQGSGQELEESAAA